jgi:hypothetical protein
VRNIADPTAYIRALLGSLIGVVQINEEKESCFGVCCLGKRVTEKGLMGKRNGTCFRTLQGAGKGALGTVAERHIQLSGYEGELFNPPCGLRTDLTVSPHGEFVIAEVSLSGARRERQRLTEQGSCSPEEMGVSR